MEYLLASIILLSLLGGVAHRIMRRNLPTQLNKPLNFLVIVLLGGCGVTCLLLVVTWFVGQLRLNSVASGLVGFQLYWLVIPLTAFICLIGYLLGSLIGNLICTVKKHLLVLRKSAPHL